MKPLLSAFAALLTLTTFTTTGIAETLMEGQREQSSQYQAATQKSLSGLPEKN